MAQELDDGEFWLPSEFLTDDDLLMDFKTDFSKTKRDEFSYGSGGNSFGFSSGLSSPVESVVGSTETESDEDELLSGLTRKMAHSTLQDKNLSTDYTEKGLKLSGSPQSTLCGFKPSSNQSSPNCGSRVSSPPDAKDGWNLLYAAAEEVVRMRKAEDTTPFRSNNFFPPPAVPNPVPINNSKPSTGVYQSHHAHSEAAKLAYLQLQANHFQRIKQQQMMKSGVWGQQGKVDYQFQNPKMNGEVGRTQGLSMASWPTLQQSQQQPQQQTGSGMRAVFLAETVPKKERTGTGVFLPRRYATNPTGPTETRKKQGCSTVLLPEKVVHALNLNLDSVDARPITRNNGPMSQQRRPHMRQPVINQELRLPQEWTY